MGHYKKQLGNIFDSEKEAAASIAPDREKRVKDVTNEIEEEYQKRINKKTIEETHCRVTFLLNRELNSRLNKIAETKERGWKTLALNKAVQSIINEIEWDK